MNIREAVRLEGAMLGLDETARNLTCPSCQGGSSSERTFSVTRVAHGLVYNCYRGTCDCRGFVPTSGVLLQTPDRPKDDGLRPYKGEYKPLTLDDGAYFSKRFGLYDIPSYAIGYNERDEYVFAVRDPFEKVRGYVVRQKGWDGSPSSPRKGVPRDARDSKSKLLMHQQGPTQSWFLGRDTSRVVLVEDHISALKVRQAGYTGVAIIGTHLDEAKVREIAQQQPDEVIIALDQDATSTAFKHARRWGLAFKKIRVAMLMFDIKDTPNENIDEVLGL